MSKSLSSKWLLQYLTKMAEEHGGDLLNIRPSTESKKVQLVKFLTHQSPGETNWVWAVVSDFHHSVPVRFSKGAMETHNRNPIFDGNPFTSYKTVLIKISQYRPMLARVPIPDKGMTKEELIVLEVDAFDVIGSVNAGIWGEPKQVGMAEDIKAWVEGLRAGGGGGNILKQRKLEREQASSSKHTLDEVEPSRSVSPPLRTQPNANNPRRRRSPSVTKTRPQEASRDTRGKPAIRSKARERRERTLRVVDIDLWPAIVAFLQNDSQKLRSPVAQESAASQPTTPKKRRDALAFSSSQPSPPREVVPSSRKGSSLLGSDLSDDDVPIPHTPSQWSPSVHGTPRRRRLDSDDDMAGAPNENREAPDTDSDSVDLFGERVISNGRRTRSPNSPALSPEAPVTGFDDEHEPPLTDHDIEEDAEGDNHDIARSQPPMSSLPASSYPAPTPAQRPRAKSALPSSHPTPGNILVPDSTQAVPAPSFPPPSPLPSSSPPKPSQSWLSPPKSADWKLRVRTVDARSDGLPQVRQNYAVSGTLTKESYGRILVPNSDTSGTTGSQSQPSQRQPANTHEPVLPPSLSGLPASKAQALPGTQDPEKQLSGTQAPADQRESQGETQGESQESGGKSGQSLSYMTISQESQPQDKQDAPALEPPAVEAGGEDVDVDVGESPVVAKAEGRLSQAGAEILPTPLSPLVQSSADVPQDRPPTRRPSEAARFESVPPIAALKEPDSDDISNVSSVEPPAEEEDEIVSDDTTEAEDEDDGAMDVDVHTHAVVAVQGYRKTKTLSAAEIEALKQEEEESQSQSQQCVQAKPAQVLLEDGDGDVVMDVETTLQDDRMDSDDERTEAVVRASLARRSPEPSSVEQVEKQPHVEPASPSVNTSHVEPTSPSADASFTSRLLSGFVNMFTSNKSSSPVRASAVSVPLTPSKPRSEDTRTAPVTPVQVEGTSSTTVVNADHDAEAWKMPSFMRRQPQAQSRTPSVPPTSRPLERPEPFSPQPSRANLPMPRRASPLPEPERVPTPAVAQLQPISTEQRRPVPLPPRARKRKAASNASEASESSRAPAKRRRVRASEPISVPSSPEMPRKTPRQSQGSGASPSRAKDRESDVLPALSPPKVELKDASSETTDPPPKVKANSRAKPALAQPTAKPQSPNNTTRTSHSRAPTSDAAPRASASGSTKSEGASTSKSAPLPTMSAKARGKQPVKPVDFRASAPAIAPSAGSAKSAKSTKAAARQPTSPLQLGGYKIDLSLKASDCNGLLTTWQDLDAALLRIGKVRYRDRREREKQKEREGMGG